MITIWDGSSDSGSIALQGATVGRIEFSYSLIFFLDEVGSIRIGAPMTIHHGSEEPLTMDPEVLTAVGVGAVVTALHGSLDAADIGATRTLSLRFSSGLRIEVPADPAYEAWQVNSVSGEILLAMPGGDLAYWPPRDG